MACLSCGLDAIPPQTRCQSCVAKLLVGRYRETLLRVLGPTRYASCVCGVSLTDTDFETRDGVVYCIACDRAIGDAQ